MSDLHKLSFQDESFDFVYCMHVLEHCLDPVMVLDELMRVAKIGRAIYCSFPLEDHVSGKHTTAIHSMKSVGNILKEMRYNFEPLYVGMANDTSVVIPEGDETIIFVIKKSTQSKENEISDQR